MAEDPRVVLERLHDELVKANAEVDAFMKEWRTKWMDPDLRESYYIAQEKALRLAQRIAAHRTEHGV